MAVCRATSRIFSRDLGLKGIFFLPGGTVIFHVLPAGDSNQTPGSFCAALSVRFVLYLLQPRDYELSTCYAIRPAFICGTDYCALAVIEGI